MTSSSAHRVSRVLVGVSATYTLLVVACVVALFSIPVFSTFMEGEQMGSGCYITEAFLAGASCQGFPGSDAVAFLLQVPFHLVLGPIFGLSLFIGAIASGEFVETFRGALYCAFSVSLWAPMVYLWRATRPAARP